ncbi:hypothetical protein SAMN05443634_10316 [Chishuiella changwenlii]|uniref:Uncharacterized protein n=3 Tax=Chishuiella changwenlii TaxID=1434701 RepID=A0A1M6UQD1_9FLAO|nr:hypothetical protein SAMN05443634_10316 [Chishuiella changwenlii]
MVINIKKYILLIFVIIFIVTLFFFIFNYMNVSMKKIEKITIEKIIVFNDKDSLYITANSWGLAGNNEVIVLSQSNKKTPNKIDDYIFYTSEIFYKIDNNNTIIIYSPESSINEPDKKISNVTIRSLKTFDEINDYNLNFKKYGLERISINR